MPVRGRIDYRMARRALLREVRAGVKGREDVCDAHRELVRAGRHIGEDVDEPCPVCEGDELRTIRYVFPEKGPSRHSGKAMVGDALEAHAKRHGDTRVFLVEICHECAWHHLLESYWFVPRRPRDVVRRGDETVTASVRTAVSEPATPRRTTGRRVTAPAAESPDRRHLRPL